MCNQEIEKRLENPKINKIGETDEIDPFVLKMCTGTLCTLGIIFRESIRQGCVPKKIERVIFPLRL
jgi:hypothetical protein